jgi:hypothetical protein
MERARGNAVRALLVLLHLLEGDAKGFRHLCLALAGLQASGTQPRADGLIDNAGLSWHVEIPSGDAGYCLCFYT